MILHSLSGQNSERKEKRWLLSNSVHWFITGFPIVIHMHNFLCGKQNIINKDYLVHWSHEPSPWFWLLLFLIKFPWEHLLLVMMFPHFKVSIIYKTSAWFPPLIISFHFTSQLFCTWLHVFTCGKKNGQSTKIRQPTVWWECKNKHKQTKHKQKNKHKQTKQINISKKINKQTK